MYEWMDGCIDGCMDEFQHYLMIQVLDAKFALDADFGKARNPSYPLPHGVTRASIGVKLAGRLQLRNYLDPFTYNIQWARQMQWAGPGIMPNIFTGYRQQEVGPGGLILRGDLLDPYFTGLPRVHCTALQSTAQYFVSVL
jgi:hypothetical protein